MLKNKDDLQLIQKINTILVSNLDFEEMSQKIVNLMNEKLESTGGVLFLVDQAERVAIPYASTHRKKCDQVLKKYLPHGLRVFHQAAE